MLVLAMDTSTPEITGGVVRLPGVGDPADELAGGGAGTHADDRADDSPALLAERTRVDAFGHAEHLMPLLRAALADAGVTLADIDAIVVGLGPGPFTGLRVGIATGAALADGLARPAFGVPSHDAFAAGLDDVLVATDARRKEVHLSRYRDGVTLTGPEPVAVAGVADWLGADRPAALTGAGAGLIADAVGIPVVECAVPTSLGLVRAAAAAIRSGAPGDPLTPLYLRRPDATEPAARKSVLG